jgi:predicted Zn finger-like uncharacterized protein
MIIACPKCGQRYRIDESRLAGSGRRLRCTACQATFAAGPPVPAQGEVAAGAGQAEGRGAAPRRGPAAGSAGALVLVADEAREFRDLVRRTLESLGCRVETTDDGEAAFRFAVARRPVLMILNVYLRKLLGVAVCEGIKGSPDLRSTRVALVGSVFKSDRFVRGPGNLYGADDYFEDVIPPHELADRMERLLQGAAPAPQGARAAASPPSSAMPARSPLEPRAEIRRLARIMLSDLKIYHPEDFHAAVLERRFFETFREELLKGKELIIRRFPDLPERLEVLASALREGLEEERTGRAARPAGSLA